MSTRFLYKGIVLVLIAAVWGWGCGQKKPSVGSVKKRVTQRASQEHAVASTTQPAGQGLLPLDAGDGTDSSYQYDAAGKRDPFKTFLQLKSSLASTQKEPKILTPLQRYDLDQLKIVGTIIGLATQDALVEDDAGKGYIVRVGDLIGNQGGKVAEVQKDRIVVEEVYQDYVGNRQVRRIEKKLHTPVEGEGS